MTLFPNKSISEAWELGFQHIFEEVYMWEAIQPITEGSLKLDTLL